MNQVAIVDDHSLLLNLLEDYINSESEFNVTASFTSGNKLLSATKHNNLNYDYLILDLFMEDGDGFTVIEELKKQNNNIKIIVMTFNKEPGLIEQILRNGVLAVVNKASEDSEIIKALNSVKNNENYLCPVINDSLEKKRKSVHDLSDSETLTKREREIVKLICLKEMTNIEIAEKLYISEKTVKTHRKNIYRKLGVNSGIALLRVAVKLGYVTI